MKKRGAFDFGFFLTVMILLSFGLIMVFSASSAQAFYDYGDAYYVIKRQLIWAALGLLAMFFMASFDYKKLIKLSFPLLLISIVLLLLVFVVGKEAKGATRWLGIGGLTFQPSEMAKIAIIIFFSASLSRNKKNIKNFTKGFLPYILVLGVVAGIVFKQRHLSGTIVISLVGLIILFIAGARIVHFIAFLIPAIPVLVYAILIEPFRINRIVSFIDPWKYKMKEGYQAIQSLYAIGSGGIFGLGLGRSRQKFLYIPEAHNDFIFAILCEELGFVGAITAIVLFIILIWKGIVIALNAPDEFGSFLTVGVTLLIAVQVIINIAVVTSSMPVTGMPLPFFSAGGSSLVFLMASVGIVLNVSRYTKKSRR